MTGKNRKRDEQTHRTASFAPSLRSTVRFVSRVQIVSPPVGAAARGRNHPAFARTRKNTRGTEEIKSSSQLVFHKGA